MAGCQGVGVGCDRMFQVRFCMFPDLRWKVRCTQRDFRVGGCSGFRSFKHKGYRMNSYHLITVYGAYAIRAYFKANVNDECRVGVMPLCNLLLTRPMDHLNPSFQEW